MSTEYDGPKAVLLEQYLLYTVAISVLLRLENLA